MQWYAPKPCKILGSMDIYIGSEETMETKHTPGPSEIGIVNYGNDAMELQLRGKVLARVYGHERTEYSRLFAAAPGLLEACESAADFLNEGWVEDRLLHDDDDGQIGKRLYDIESAIAAAKGGE